MDAATLRTLDRERYVSLVTFRKTGREVATPVWWALDGERFYLFSEADAGKMKRLRNSPRVKLAACSVRGKVHGAWYEGRAHEISDPTAIERAYAALHEKYGWQMRLADFFSRLSGRIHGRAVVELHVGGPAPLA